MPDKKVELQVTLEAILDKKKGKHGNLFQIKIKHYKPMWVSDQKVSKEAVAAYLSGSRGVPKNSYVVLARRYAKPPVDTKMKSIHSFFGKRSPPKTSAGSPEKKRSRNDVGKTGTETERTSAMLMAAREYISEQTSKTGTKSKKRRVSEMLMAGWCGKARSYIKKFNTILDLKNKTELAQVINKAKKELEPNKECLHLFRSENFQTGTFIKHHKEYIHCLYATETTGEISCAVCEQNFKFSRACRVINHCFHKSHIANLKAKQDDNLQQRRDLDEFTKAGRKEETIVRRVQKCVAQQIALKGLPFTAGNKYPKKPDK